MCGKHKLDVCLSCSLNLRGVRQYFHAFVCGIYACGNKSARTNNLDKAKTTCTYLIYILEVAKRRNIDPGIAARLKNRRLGRNTVVSAVDFYIYRDRSCKKEAFYIRRRDISCP